MVTGLGFFVVYVITNNNVLYIHLNDHLLDSKTKCIWLIMDSLASRTCQNTCLSFDSVTAHDNAFFTVSYFPSTALSDDKFPWVFTNVELWLVGRFKERFTEICNMSVCYFVHTNKTDMNWAMITFTNIF